MLVSGSAVDLMLPRDDFERTIFWRGVSIVRIRDRRIPKTNGLDKASFAKSFTLCYLTLARDMPVIGQMEAP
jgi:hypothetical protein